MAVGVARKGWDIDLLEGVAREGAFRDAMLKQRVRYFEHKSDEMCRFTGNVFIELQQHIRGQWERSGLAVTEADSWAFEYAPRCWVMVETRALRTLAHEMLDERGFAKGGDFNNYKGVLVPIERLVRIGRTPSKPRQTPGGG